jgi:hypothetical protein
MKCAGGNTSGSPVAIHKSPVFVTIKNRPRSWPVLRELSDEAVFISEFGFGCQPVQICSLAGREGELWSGHSDELAETRDGRNNCINRAVAGLFAGESNGFFGNAGDFAHAEAHAHQL